MVSVSSAPDLFPFQVKATFAPSRAATSQMPWPNPPEPPVTSTRNPSISRTPSGSVVPFDCPLISTPTKIYPADNETGFFACFYHFRCGSVPFIWADKTQCPAREAPATRDKLRHEAGCQLKHGARQHPTANARALIWKQRLVHPYDENIRRNLRTIANGFRHNLS